MNEQEVIGRIRYRIMTASEIAGKGSDGKTFEDLEMAIEALDKQQAKKPHIWGDGYADGQLVYDSWDCPNCGKTYELEYDEYKHCPECGQKLDWSDE